MASNAQLAGSVGGSLFNYKHNYPCSVAHSFIIEINCRPSYPQNSSEPGGGSAACAHYSLSVRAREREGHRLSVRSDAAMGSGGGRGSRFVILVHTPTAGNDLIRSRVSSQFVFAQSVCARMSADDNSIAHTLHFGRQQSLPSSVRCWWPEQHTHARTEKNTHARAQCT